MLADDTEDLLGPELFSKSSTTRLYTGGLNTGPLLIWAKQPKNSKKGGRTKGEVGSGIGATNLVVLVGTHSLHRDVPTFSHMKQHRVHGLQLVMELTLWWGVVGERRSSAQPASNFTAATTSPSAVCS